MTEMNNNFLYVQNSPVNYVDPFGLDIMVIENGQTLTYGGNSPACHTAIPITGQGVFSFGNDTNAGSSVEGYLLNQAQKRDYVLFIIEISREQDAAALAYLKSFGTTQLPPHASTKDNCSSRMNRALVTNSI
jgi:hypothetical protein